MADSHPGTVPSDFPGESSRSAIPEPARPVRLAFILPGSTSTARPEVVVPAQETVLNIKSRLAGLLGVGGDGQYTLIARGRVMRDEERVGECFPGDEGVSHYVHVVQRHTPGQASQASRSAAPLNPTPTPTMPPIAGPSTSTSPLMLNPTYLALHDSTLFLTFRAARALDVILARPPRSWGDITPAPRVSEGEATSAVGRFLEVNGLGMGEDGWETRGRAVSDGLQQAVERGEEASLLVDVDGAPNKLVIPDPRALSDEVVRALGEHKHIIETIAALQALQRDVPMYILFPTAPSQAAPTPTPTAPLPAAAPPNPRVFAIQLRLSTLPLRLLPTALMSLVKVSIVLWMLTRHMRWTDRTFLSLAAMGGAWWIWEVGGLIKREREREAGARRAEEGLRRARQEREASEVGRTEAPVDQAAAPARVARPPAGVPDLPNRRRNRQAARTPFAIALHGLDHERRRLRLFYVDPRVGASVQNATDHRIPSSDANLPIPPRDPNFLWTWLIMPLYLFVLSATPPADAARKMAIRQREVHMRLLVQKLTQAAESEVRRVEAVERAAGEGEVSEAQAVVVAPDDRPPYPPILPRALSKSAERYYRRVLAKGETVDWEEEREAQAALLREAGGGGDPAGEEIAFF